MELAIISPISLLELSGLVDRFHMVLPEGLVRSEEYKSFYRDCKGYKVLDNGLVEGVQYDGVELNQMARSVGANCIIVPDLFRATDATIEKCRTFKRHRNAELDYMGVLQGRDLMEYLKCLYFYDHTPWITHIGLPRIMCELHKLQRVTFLESIRIEQAKGNIRGNLKFHALGGSPWIQEVLVLSETNCDSMDTSLPVVLGLEGKGLTGPYLSRSHDFMSRDVNRQSMTWRVLYDNVVKYLEWAGHSISGGTEG